MNGTTHLLSDELIQGQEQMVDCFEKAMQAVNHELIQCIEELKATKSNLETQIETEEAEKYRLEREVERMSMKINQLKESLSKKSAALTDYEKTIQESESAYMKILESSQLLLNMVKREKACLDQEFTGKVCCGTSSVDNISIF